ncbi:MAG: hypothetical protein K2X01_10915 [Cyanobacteria bacterium]|nr:hypothetical protein [Cyanobacteriota bacterium]
MNNLKMNTVTRFSARPVLPKRQHQAEVALFSGNRYTPKPKNAAKKTANEVKDFARTHGRSIAFSLGGSLAGSFLLGGIIGGLPGSIVGLVVGIVADTQLRKRGI